MAPEMTKIFQDASEKRIYGRNAMWWVEVQSDGVRCAIRVGTKKEARSLAKCDWTVPFFAYFGFDRWPFKNTPAATA